MTDSKSQLVPQTLPIVLTDPFAALFAHATPRARTFFSGNLCQTAHFAGSGHVHFLKSGALTLRQEGAADIAVMEPSLVLFARARPHGIIGDPERGADLACATVELGGAAGNPIGEGLPELIILALAGNPALEAVCALITSEAFGQASFGVGGRDFAIDRLFDYLLILIIRHVVASGRVDIGVLAGLADPRLARALTAMHEAPKERWTLDSLADVAGMSRTRFAEHFRSQVGRTPIDYLTVWRMVVARQLLAQGKPVKSVATQVGYDSAAAFSRVFSRVTGHAPRQAFLAS